MIKINNYRGDTIVEVLLSLTVLAAVLMGAYVAANRTQSASQASQERVEALKQIESQIERLKEYDKSAINDGDPFCIDFDNNFIDITSVDPFGDALDTATLPYDASCGNIEGRYNVAAQKVGDTYEFLARWDRVNGGRDQINMYYRTY